MMKTKLLIKTLIYWQISFEKYVSKHLISLLYNYYFVFRRRYLIIWKNRFWKRTQPNSWFWTSILHSNLVIIRLKWILKSLSTILHTQFIHHTLPVTPFKANAYIYIYIFTNLNLWYLTVKIYIVWTSCCQDKRTSKFKF